MPWGKPDTRNKPFESDYNRAYDTHTQHGKNNAFENNDVNVADVTPEFYSGLGPGPDRAYKNPSYKADQIESTDRHAIWNPEKQTGNAPSGGYSTLPYYGFASTLYKDPVGYDTVYPQYSDGVGDSLGQWNFPDPRRMGDHRPLDWEHDQKKFYIERAAEREHRRDITGHLANERMADRPKLKVPNDKAPHPVEHSPYEKLWSEGDRLTSGENPNPWRFWRDWDRAAEYRNSGSRYYNGYHYSLAQHKTLIPYDHQMDGMNPVTQVKRNTYRIDPAPWDLTNTESPENTPGYKTTGGALDGSVSYGVSYRL